MEPLTTAADVIQATEITFEDDPVGGILVALFGLMIAAYFVDSGRKWRAYTARQRERIRKAGMEQYVSHFPWLDYVLGMVMGVLCLVVFAVSCVALITRVLA